MKFTDGKWLIREGYELSSPLEVRDYEIGEDSLTLYAPGKHIRHRGDTLDGPLFTITLSAPMNDVIKVRFEHFKGGYERTPSFEINEPDNADIEIED